MPHLHRGNIEIHYIVGPQKGRPWLVLSNSLGTDLSMWDAQMPAFERDLNVLRYDNRGHGRSAKFAGPLTLAELAGDVLALMDSLGISNAAYCGLSLGGMVGQYLAINARERLSALVLCCTAAKIGTEATWNERIAQVKAAGFGGMIPSILDRWFTPAFRTRSPEEVQRTRSMLERTDAQSYAASCAAIRDADFTHELSAIDVPTLVVCGAQDPVTPPSDARFLSENISGCRLLQLNAAHLANIEASEPFTARVSEFLLKTLNPEHRDARH